MTFNNF